MGSKRRLAKYLVPIFKKEIGNRAWVEPFCGGANLTIFFDGVRYCNDLNEYVVECLKQVSLGWIPPTEISKEQYIDIRDNKDKYPKHLVGFVGICCSFGTKWFGGYSRGKQGDRQRNYAQEGHDALLRQKPSLKEIIWSSVDYREMYIPNNSLIYCDPPYNNSTGYKDKNFNHDEFYKWCLEKKKEGHLVYISEFEAPFEILFEKARNCGGTMSKKNKNLSKVERLYKV